MDLLRSVVERTISGVLNNELVEECTVVQLSWLVVECNIVVVGGWSGNRSCYNLTTNRTGRIIIEHYTAKEDVKLD